MRRRTQRRAGLLALLVALTTVAGGAPAASAAEPTVRILEAGAVVAGGAGIVYDAVVTCDAGSAQIITRVTQRQADGSLVKATGSQSVPCTGPEQVARVLVTTADDSTSVAPFSPGTAFVTAYLPLPGGLPVRYVTASRTVQTPAVEKNVALTGLVVDATLPSSARLEADGAGAKVYVPYRCPPGAVGSLSARLLQRMPTGAVMRSGSRAAFSCTGADRSAALTFHAGPAAWQPGDALLVVEGTSRPSADGPGSTAYAHRTLSLTTSAVASPAGEPAPGEGSLRIREAAGAQARGAGLAVDLVLTCTGGGPQSYGVGISVTQRQPDGSLLHGGSFQRHVTCTGAPQVVRMATDLQGVGVQAPFRPGVALLTAEGAHGDTFTGGELRGGRTVQVSNVTLDAARLTASGLSATLPAGMTLGADGTATVRVPHRCASGDTGRLGGTLSQRTSADAVTNSFSNREPDGYSISQELTCTGATQSVTLTFAAESAPWKTGPALLQVHGQLVAADGSSRRVAGHRTVSLG